ncbi:glycerophosphodiester phosphodiesterase [Paenibacillus polymyxa]|uniref:glycerophosphodiester phosphodiesterase n=1 Tax=Paenibacillus polymyxa TaxID=1406 RepID=UPI0025B711B5|nr:glycerophosphodiester phosphodiesterase family protein [Paenibacillus polymyxa]MDN4085498.1 glycerophosphodiester phosphodiesterase family protein [Paenibacillus polymyxa]MDN4087145.1 glycerophosphodiester phosphodiesterase family protein [Paenibacillus polymyxa]MDN4108766.1 glycerophosphodiester phosphodiesterase family protein [Paenibacillus polymyxa]
MNHMCVAHRGFSGIAPENTMAAFKLALEQPFVHWIELDVQLSKDGVPVVFHDFTLERTTNGTGRVKDADWKDLQRLDAGSWKNAQYHGEPIPSLAQVLDLCQGRVSLNIELKTAGDMYPGLEKVVLREIIMRGMEGEVVLTSFERAALRRAKELAPEIRTGLIIDARPDDLAKQLENLQCSFLSIGYPRLDRKLLKDLIGRGITVMAWTVDDRRIMRRLSSLHPELMICTNWPNRWEQVFLLSKPRLWHYIRKLIR